MVVVVVLSERGREGRWWSVVVLKGRRVREG